MPPSPLGSVQVKELVSVSGDLRASELTAPLSIKTSLLAFVPLPPIVTLPDAVIGPELIAPEVLMVVEPLITDAPLIVPLLMNALFSVLFVSVAVPDSVTITPLKGNVAVELIPVPPRLEGKIPVTADACDRLIEPKVGVPPPLGTIRLWNGAPAAVEYRLPSAFPMTTPFGAKLVEPVPPLVTPMTPDPMIEAGKVGMSVTVMLPPANTRPLVSTRSFV